MTDEEWFAELQARTAWRPPDGNPTFVTKGVDTKSGVPSPKRTTSAAVSWRQELRGELLKRDAKIHQLGVRVKAL